MLQPNKLISPIITTLFLLLFLLLLLLLQVLHLISKTLEIVIIYSRCYIHNPIKAIQRMCKLELKKEVPKEGQKEVPNDTNELDKCEYVN